VVTDSRLPGEPKDPDQSHLVMIYEAFAEPAERAAFRADLKAAGFSDVSVDIVDARSKAPSARDAAIAYCQGTPLKNEIEARDASRMEEATTKATDAVARRFGNGAVDGRIRAFVITAPR